MQGFHPRSRMDYQQEYYSSEQELPAPTLLLRTKSVLLRYVNSQVVISQLLEPGFVDYDA